MRKVQTILVGAILTATCSVTAAQHRGYTDDQVRVMVEHDLQRHDISGVSVTVQGSVVTLKGSVGSSWEKEKAIEAAVDVHDVIEVVNELTVRRGESDQAVADQIGAAIERYVFYTVYDAVKASVLDGKVTLNGWVTWPYKASEIANHVSRVSGVREVRNEIKVLPVSTFDDELRVRLAVAIYRDVPDLANRAHPPIHIVVDNGRVILAGAVRNNVEKVRSEHIARSMFGVLGVDNQLRVDRPSS